jgi:hypothetical protein
LVLLPEPKGGSLRLVAKRFHRSRQSSRLKPTRLRAARQPIHDSAFQIAVKVNHGIDVPPCYDLPPRPNRRKKTTPGQNKNLIDHFDVLKELSGTRVGNPSNARRGCDVVQKPRNGKCGDYVPDPTEPHNRNFVCATNSVGDWADLVRSQHRIVRESPRNPNSFARSESRTLTLSNRCAVNRLACCATSDRRALGSAPLSTRCTTAQLEVIAKVTQI